MPPDEQFRPIGANIPDIGLQVAQAGYVFRNISVDKKVPRPCNEKYYVRASSKDLWDFLSNEVANIKIVQGPPGVGKFSRIIILWLKVNLFTNWLLLYS